MTNLIALCGQKGSGKNTCGEVLDRSAGYVQVSFAKKLKDLVATVYGLDRDKLEGLTPEDREWRETYIRGSLDTRWHQSYWQRGAIVNAIKLVYGIELSEDYTQTFEQLPGMTALDIFGLFYSKLEEHVFDSFVSPRELLQVIGTEVFRSIHPDTWCMALERSIKPSLDMRLNLLLLTAALIMKWLGSRGWGAW